LVGKLGLLFHISLPFLQLNVLLFPLKSGGLLRLLEHLLEFIIAAEF
jgi:hypothetical protein